MSLTLAFDADDTLWHNESLYSVTQEQITQLLLPYTDNETLSRQLLETEKRNLRLFGYGVKGFTLSMIESAIEVSQGRVTAAEIQAILDAGKSLLVHPIELLPEVRATLEQLQPHYNLMLITKGDLFHQESRLAMSGLGELFTAVEVVSEKDVPTYQRILTRYHIKPEDFIMIGNSVRSDILPVIQLGARAIHIPYAITWELEQAEVPPEMSAGVYPLESIGQVPNLLKQLR